jgi:hypothetical protein
MFSGGSMQPTNNCFWASARREDGNGRKQNHFYEIPTIEQLMLRITLAFLG